LGRLHRAAPSTSGQLRSRRLRIRERLKAVPGFYCGQRLKKGRDKWFDPFPYGAADYLGNGLFSLTLDGWGDPTPDAEAVEGVWGMRWYYEGDGGKKESTSGWYSLAPDGYCDPDFPDCAPEP
jgi:hypothetical protein